MRQLLLSEWMESRDFMDDIVSLYRCLYDMELYKKNFISVEVKKKCLVGLVDFYSQIHKDNRIVGLFSPKNFMIDLNTGDIDTGENIDVNEGLKDCEMIKFIPPEIIRGENTWDIYADYYCLALLIYSINFGGFPFDGKRVYERPIVTIERAIEEYSNPVFIFDPMDESNRVVDSTDYRIRRLWNDESNLTLKNAYIKSFTSSVRQKECRLSIIEWMNLLGMEANQTMENEIKQQYVLSGDNVYKDLVCGTEITESDIFGGDSSNKIGVVVTSKKDASVMALGNASAYTWRLQLPDNQEMMIPPNSVAPLAKGTVIIIKNKVLNII